MKQAAKVLVLMGAAGAGKGTISKKINKDFPNIVQLSTGDLLRKNVRDRTPLGVEAKSIMEKGGLVPDAVVFSLLETEMQNINSDPEHHVLLDGFPRTLPQAVEFSKRWKVNGVISLDVPNQTIIDRISNRWYHPQSGRTYAKDYNPEKQLGFDDVTGEPLLQRDDDNPQTARRRLELYNLTKEPLLRYYNGLEDVHVGRFAGTESDMIYPQVKSFLEKDLAISPKHN
jgi:adenylate kinase